MFYTKLSMINSDCIIELQNTLQKKFMWDKIHVYSALNKMPCHTNK